MRQIQICHHFNVNFDQLRPISINQNFFTVYMGQWVWNALKDILGGTLFQISVITTSHALLIHHLGETF